MFITICLFLFTGIGDMASQKDAEELLGYYREVIHTSQFQEVQNLFRQNKYEDAFKLLADNAIKNPEQAVNYVACMVILRQQIDSNPGANPDGLHQNNSVLDVYTTIAHSILGNLSSKSRHLLLSDLAEVCLIQNEYEKAFSYLDTLINEIGNKSTREYASAVYQYATTALSAGNTLKAMQLLEELRKNQNNYPEEIQDIVNFQLFNIYSILSKEDLVIQLGEELRNKFEGKELKDYTDMYDLSIILMHLADAYMNKKLYDLAYQLYDKYIQLTQRFEVPQEKNGILTKNTDEVMRNRKTAMLYLGIYEE